ncbi:unnamed protein product (macronuclear) [Paramecium tetraurelia]|uniref:Phosphoinositide phospholipase C n=1 Tax=Paramecium tetraurelia TaxID=5888 RepID=A0C336_PARTE|nr:uncharacterized protein GSPATT00034681001 [Paramecium tetraurelia]CAK65203.1 unnamed protein product [Paramecium tetraurelia]|eukprot:XP_001432600.1 hypothetical protein (macronuclear) [Paramecium tetraurelia strain d4-2]
MNQVANHQGVNQLVYGILVKIKMHKAKRTQIILFLSPNEARMIQMLDPLGTFSNYFDLTQISDMTSEEQNKLKIINSQGIFIKLYFENYQQLNIIREGLQYLMAEAFRIQKQLDSYNQIWSNALKLITKSDLDMDNRLSFKEFQFLIGELQIEIPERKLLQLFDKHQKNNQLDEATLYKLLMEITRKHELIQLYQKYCSKQEGIFDDPHNTMLMSAHDLETFFLIEQGQKDYKAQKQCYNFYDFQNIIFNQENSIFQAKDFDKSQPLTQYLINSSHNTYLETNQLTGQSSCFAYQDAFKMGFKCVELDCWDGQDGEPNVTHGHTLVNDIKFIDVIRTVREFAFIKDDNPAILSLEMHCSLKQQRRIADIIRSVLGDMLFVIKDYKAKQFATLQELQRKVLIKYKADEEFLQEKLQLSDHSLSLSLYCTSTKEDMLIQFEDEQDNDNQLNQYSKTLDSKQGKKSCREILEITSLFAVSLKLNINPDLVWVVSSVSEDKIQDVVKKNQGKFQDYVNTYFVRIYPLGLRFDSSNYDPFPSWSAGAQMVALNIQTKDIFMLYNYGMFLNSSYVLKSKNDIQMTIFIQIISASNIVWEEEKRRQQEVVDPYIKVRIAGNKEDVNNSEKWRTEVIYDNGYHPIFNYKCKIQLKHAQQDVIYFQAYSYSLLGDSLLGQYCLSPLNLRRGYRIVPLLNSQLKPLLNSFVLVNIKIEY